MSATILLVLRIISIGVVYAFIAWALWVLWQDLRRQSYASAASQVIPIVLRLESESEQNVFRFTASQITIGRDPACECFLDESTISARHARLSYHHAQWWVEDLHSRNGTFLNELAVSGPIVLTSGDTLRCGQRVLQVSIAERAAMEALTDLEEVKEA